MFNRDFSKIVTFAQFCEVLLPKYLEFQTKVNMLSFTSSQEIVLKNEIPCCHGNNNMLVKGSLFSI